MSHRSSWRWSCPSLACWQNIQLIITLTIGTCLVCPWKTKPNVLFIQGRGSWLWDVYTETKHPLSITEILNVSKSLSLNRPVCHPDPWYIKVWRWHCTKYRLFGVLWGENFSVYRRHLMRHVPGSCKGVVSVNFVHNTDKVQNVFWETINAEMFSLILKDDLEADLIDLLLSRISPPGSKKLLLLQCVAAKP